ncbi:unnamed protein product [Aphanomyces euteiches]
MWTSFEDAGNLALPLAATASSIFLASFILRFLWKAHKLRHIPQPKTRSWLFGNALDSFGRVAQWHETGEYPEPFLGWVKEFGNVNEVIDKKLAQNNPTDKPKDLLDLVLPQFSTQEAVIHTMTFLEAGHETSSSALSWIFATICPRQDVVLRIRKEYKDVMSKHGSLSTWKASSQLKYTMAVIQETMRLNGVLHIIGTRVSINDDTFPMLDGTSVFIPAGTEVVVNVAALHRNPKYWTSADAFIPERFIQGTPEWDADLKLRDGKSHAFYYMPFGMGATSCIGQRFAMAEIQVLLAMIAGEFDVKLTPNANVRQKNNAVTLAPANLEVTIQRAETSSVAAA